ncbi:hypothetical protein [Wielerella bovis]|uniref:hypothetical protein n=1 Tax=Wielerella bovis TaxID=2917790 RepID=UPI002019F7AC|nr:hypothetical protein [Wielerella bovis]ULJ59738.1 hypothetical protein MIS44_08635 [Wielerella bovis]
MAKSFYNEVIFIFWIDDIMKKMFLLLLILCGFQAALAADWHAEKEKIAQEFVQCAENPKPDSGNAYLMGCYADATDKLIELGDDRSIKRMTGTSDIEEFGSLAMDRWLLKERIYECDKYFEKSERVQHQKVEWVTQCRFQAAKMYAEWFYRAESDPKKTDYKLNIRQLLGLP